MSVAHLMVSESKSLCGRQVVNGNGAPCKNCARIQASKGVSEVQAAQAAQATDARQGRIDVEARERFQREAEDMYFADFASQLDDELVADGTLGDFCRCDVKVTSPAVPVKVKPAIRTCLGRRKRKATKRARKHAQGVKGGK